MLRATSRWKGLLLASAGMALALGAWVHSLRNPSDASWSEAPAEIQGMLWPMAPPVAPFRMHTHDGEVFDEASLRGNWNLVFFGFLQCPDVCPSTLQSLRQLRRGLIENDPAAARHRFVFVTVDPQHDTAARIGPYLAHFDPQFLGLTGSGEELAKLARSMGVHYGPYEHDDGRVGFEHTTSIIVVDPAGRIVAALPSPHDPATMQRQFLALQRFVAD